ncbi:MAG: hypothetical protein KGI62_05425 [Xanthomonadaceae bacterium]|nr:hypothetical protein [Xanthomonadaceae bacterium]
MNSSFDIAMRRADTARMRDGTPDCASVDAVWHDTLPKVMRASMAKTGVTLPKVMPARRALSKWRTPAYFRGR